VAAGGTVRPMRRYLVPALLLVLAACGGSASSDADDGGAARSTTTTAAPAGGGFGALAARGREAEVRITYRSGGADGEFTVARYRGDTFVSFGNDATYGVDGATITCQGSGRDALCFELPGDTGLASAIVESFFGGFAVLFDAVDDAGSRFAVLEASTEPATIAGRDAECAVLSADAFWSSGSVRVCLDRQTGALLRSGAATGSGEQLGLIEATSFRSATAEDVTPPASPQPMPGV